MKLSVKLLLSILTSLALVYVIILVFQQNQLRRQIRRLSEVSLVHEEATQWLAIENLQRACNTALNDAMVGGEMGNFNRLLASQTQVRGLQELTVFTKDGVAANSTDRSLIKSRLPDALKARIQESTDAWKERTAESFIFYQPMPVVAACMECHPNYKNLKSGGLYRYKFSTDNLMKAQSEWIQFSATLQRTIRINGIWAALALLVTAAVMVTWIIRRQVTGPIQRCVVAIQKLAQGDLTASVGHESDDELGILSKAIDTSIGNLRQLVGSLSQTATELHSSAHTLTETATNQAATAEETTVQANTVASAGEQLSGNAKTMSASAAQITQSTTTVAAAMEEMSSSIQEVARNCAQESEIARQADTQARQTRELMGKLEDSARQIGKVVELINRIAEQTNLLALNATIEAASAGEAGRGFAVVANEVKELARQSASATEDIRKQVALIQDNTGASIKSLDEVGKIIEQVAHISSSIAAAVEEQSATTAEIVGTIHGVSTATGTLSQNVQQTAEGAAEVARNIEGVSSAAQEAAKGVHRISNSATELSRLSATLGQLVARFKITEARSAEVLSAGVAGGPPAGVGASTGGTVEALMSAIAAHGEWKQRLRESVASGCSDFDPALVCLDNQCAFGKWLYRCDGTTQAGARWKCVRTHHAHFHQEAGRVLKLALGGQKGAAEAALVANSKFAQITQLLTREVIAWKQEAS